MEPGKREEIGRRGQELYEKSNRQIVETQENRGKQIVIDVESGAFEIDHERRDDGIVLSRRLLARRPNAVLYGLRIGHKGVYALSGNFTLSVISGDYPLTRSRAIL